VLAPQLGCWLEHLAQGSEATAAERLARQVLFLSAADGECIGWSHDLVGRLRPHWYGEFLKKFPALVRATPERALSLLLDVLDNALKLSRGGEQQTESGCLEDYSTTWRNNIARGEAWSTEDYRQHLIDALQAAMPLLLVGAEASVEATVRRLEEKRWVTFHRIALDALSRAPLPESLDSTRSRLLDQSRLQDSSLRREYDGLLAARFNALDTPEQEALLQLIDLGPRHYDAAQSTKEGDELWRYGRLRLIAPHLDTKHSRSLKRFETKFAAFEKTESALVSGWVTDPSPLDAAQLANMPVPEVISFLRAWEPPTSGFPRPTRRALALQIEKAIQSEPRRFIEAAEGFAGVHLEYQAFILRAIASAVEGGYVPQWTPLLGLCTTIMERDESDNELKRALLRVIGTGFNSGGTELPITAREMVWPIISHLTRDPNPNPDDERSFASPAPDPITTAINSVRGVAVEAVVKYALWVSRATLAATTAARSFDIMPEAREVLEERLDHANERTIAVRSVFGRFLPQLFWLDSEWTREHIQQVFPADAELAELRDAAWESFVLVTPVYSDLFKALRTQYEDAVQRLEAPRFEWHHLGDPLVALGRHLVTLYGRGTLPLDDKLMQTLFSGLNAERREDVLTFIGRALRGEEEIEADILSRYQALWKWRRQEIELGRGDSSELRAFVWWFSSNRFDDQWAVAQLTHALSLTPCENLLPEVAQRLARATAVPTLDLVKALEQVVSSDRWGVISMYEGSAREIMRRALEGGGEARVRAMGLIDRLARSGYFGFTDLVGRPPRQTS
jgi:hypothetical protein